MILRLKNEKKEQLFKQSKNILWTLKRKLTREVWNLRGKKRKDFKFHKSYDEQIFSLEEFLNLLVLLLKKFYWMSNRKNADIKIKRTRLDL